MAENGWVSGTENSGHSCEMDVDRDEKKIVVLHAKFSMNDAEFERCNSDGWCTDFYKMGKISRMALSRELDIEY